MERRKERKEKREYDKKEEERRRYIRERKFGPRDRPPTHLPFSEIDCRLLAFGLGLGVVVVQFVSFFAVVLRTKNRV